MKTPLNYDEIEDDRGLPSIFEITDRIGTPICDVDDEDTAKTLIKSVNAHDELIEALEKAEKYMSGQRAKSNAPFDPEALKAARAALAKARG